MSNFQEVEEDVIDNHNHTLETSEQNFDSLPDGTTVEEEANIVDDEDITSSFDNIVPPQVKKGWGIFFNWAASTASIVKEKAVEINNSDTVQAMKAKTVEAVTQVGEAAAPIWEITKDSLSTAAEKTSEQASIVAERLQPTLDSVSQQLSQSATSGWNSLSNAAAKLMDLDSEENTSVDRDVFRLPPDENDVAPAIMDPPPSPMATQPMSKGPLVL